MPMGTNLSAPPWVSSTVGYRTRTPDVYSSLAQRRSWLPVNGSSVADQHQQPIPRQRSHPSLSSTSTTSSSVPPDVPLDTHGMRSSRSCVENNHVTASPPTTPMLPLPDMSERQVNIQRSLFKMLGQHE